MRIARPSSIIYYVLLALILGGGVAVIGGRAAPGGEWFGLVPVLLIALYALRRPLRRRALARQAVPADWRAWLEAHVPFYQAAEAPARRRFERDVQFFLNERAFEGIDGVDVTDPLRLAVASGAALLLHGRPDWELPAVPMLLYPGRFDDDYHGGVYAEYDGMAHEQGPVLLSAPAVEASWAGTGDGSNVVLHELAHLFDFKNAGADGIPSLMDPSSEAAWQALVRREMDRIRQGDSLLRRYGATAPSEFFAVAVENFFERPEALRERHAELFEALASFFNFDPRPGVAHAESEW